MGSYCHYFSPIRSERVVCHLQRVRTNVMFSYRFDDLLRYKADKQFNSRRITVARRGQFISIASEAIRMGDIVRIEDHQESVFLFPPSPYAAFPPIATLGFRVILSCSRRAAYQRQITPKEWHISRPVHNCAPH